MKASTTRFTWFLLATAVIGPLVFLGCFLKSKGLAGDSESCTPLDHDFHGCFLSERAGLRFDVMDDPENEDCNQLTGGGYGLFGEEIEHWGFNGEVTEETEANLTIDRRGQTSDPVVVALSQDGEILTVDDPAIEVQRVGDECPTWFTYTTSWSPPEGWPERLVTKWFLQDDGPEAWVSMEAENYHFYQPGENENREWQLSTEPPGYSGEGNMEATGPAVTDEDIDDTIPRLDYHIKFAENVMDEYCASERDCWASGQVGVWLRLWAHGAQSGRILIGLDGVYQTWTAADTTISEYGWYGYPTHGITVDEPGIHTLNLWMNAAGVKVDKIVLGRWEHKPTDLTAPPESPEETWLDDD